MTARESTSTPSRSNRNPEQRSSSIGRNVTLLRTTGTEIRGDVNRLLSRYLGAPGAIVPVIAQGLADVNLVTIAGGSGAGAPETTVQNITAVIQTALAAQLVTRGGLLDREPPDGGNDRQADVPRLAEASPPKKEPASAKPAWQQ